MTVSRERHKSGAAAIRMQLLESDHLCGGGGGVHRSDERRAKDIEFTIKPNLTKGESREAIGWTIGLIAATYVSVGMVLAFLYRDGNSTLYPRRGFTKPLHFLYM